MCWYVPFPSRVYANLQARRRNELPLAGEKLSLIAGYNVANWKRPIVTYVFAFWELLSEKSCFVDVIRYYNVI